MIARHPEWYARNLSILIAGSAGQGVTLAGDMLIEAALQAGWQADVLESHRFARPNTMGLVQANVLLAPHGPLTPSNTQQFDFVLSHGWEGIAQRMQPLTAQGRWLVGLPAKSIPAEFAHAVHQERVIAMPTAVDEKLRSARPSIRMLALLGHLSSFLEWDAMCWQIALQTHLPKKLQQEGTHAFELMARLPVAASTSWDV